MVVKDALLAVIERNRGAHRQIFIEALEGYRKQAIELLEEQIGRAKSGKNFKVQFQLVQPMDHTRDYDRIIGMLKMNTGGYVELSEDDYRAYVMDDWAWKNQFLATNSRYSQTALSGFDPTQG